MQEVNEYILKCTLFQNQLHTQNKKFWTQASTEIFLQYNINIYIIYAEDHLNYYLNCIS